ncbi:MAG TPA: hypothetical protein DEF79_14105, partial [Gammaproteobacteria bacterium]|nr:hypothetical protein [Gammaproteobacteria bacterium]
IRTCHDLAMDELISGCRTTSTPSFCRVSDHVIAAEADTKLIGCLRRPFAREINILLTNETTGRAQVCVERRHGTVVNGWIDLF